jgi:hypothetical protein
MISKNHDSIINLLLQHWALHEQLHKGDYKQLNQYKC